MTADLTAGPRVTAITLAYGDEPLLEDCVRALVESEDVLAEVIVVDNGCTSGAVDRIPGHPRVRVLRPGQNTGFAGGCNLGARHATGDVLVLVNSDAVVQPGALAALVRRVDDPAVGLATANVRMMQDPAVVNTVGNPVHFTGLSWAGGLGDPADRHARPTTVAGASGCAMAVRRDVWNALGGFFESMFAYCEDTDLSLRCWQAGWTVEYVPEAEVHHHYEFSRHAQKLYLLERNRLLMLLTVYSARTLLLLALPLLALEAAVAVTATRGGWLRQKVRAWWWLVRHARLVRDRRAEVQASRRRSDAVLVPVLTGAFTPGAGSGVPRSPLLSALSRGYWAAVRRLIR